MATSTPGHKNAATDRVRQHRAMAGMIRVEVEVPTREDALTVRRFARMRRRATEPLLPTVDVLPAASMTTVNELGAVLATMDAMRQAIMLKFGEALADATKPDMLTRGQRVALNFAEFVARRHRDMSLRVDDVSR